MLFVIIPVRNFYIRGKHNMSLKFSKRVIHNILQCAIHAGSMGLPLKILFNFFENLSFMWTRFLIQNSWTLFLLGVFQSGIFAMCFLTISSVMFILPCPFKLISFAIQLFCIFLVTLPYTLDVTPKFF